MPTGQVAGAPIPAAQANVMSFLESMTFKKVFYGSLLVVLLYYLSWFALRAGGIYWQPFNIPGFLFLFASMPWSLPIANDWSEITNLLGRDFRNIIAIVVISFGFSLNAGIVVILIRNCVILVKRRVRNGPQENS